MTPSPALWFVLVVSCCSCWCLLEMTVGRKQRVAQPRYYEASHFYFISIVNTGTLAMQRRSSLIGAGPPRSGTSASWILKMNCPSSVTSVDCSSGFTSYGTIEHAGQARVFKLCIFYSMLFLMFWQEQNMPGESSSPAECEAGEDY